MTLEGKAERTEDKKCEGIHLVVDSENFNKIVDGLFRAKSGCRCSGGLGRPVEIKFEDNVSDSLQRRRLYLRGKVYCDNRCSCTLKVVQPEKEPNKKKLLPSCSEVRTLQVRPRKPKTGSRVLSDGNEDHREVAVNDRGSITGQAKKKIRRSKDRNVYCKTVTLRRSKARYITYSDGLEVVQELGGQSFNYSSPCKQDGDQEAREEGHDLSSDRFIYVSGRPKGKKDRQQDNSRHCLQTVLGTSRKPSIESSVSSMETRPLENTRLKGRWRKKPSFNPAYLHPLDWSRIMPRGYNPLTWLYRNYSKTKTFVKEFSTYNF